MSWSSRRKSLYLGSILLFLVVVVGIPLALWLYEQPTCSDGVQNQEELGVDVGGPCTILHSSQVQDAVVLWSRPFEVLPGVFSVVSYVDNPNFSAGVKDIAYWFKLFDENNILVAERRGRTFISPNGIIPLFEGGIQTNNRVPTRAFFEFTEVPVWEKVTEPVTGLSVGTRVLEGEDSAPRLEAVIENTSFENIRDIEIVATLFDSGGNAIGASRTTIGTLGKQSSETVVFTWPQPFAKAVSKIEILPRAPFNN